MSKGRRIFAFLVWNFISLVSQANTGAFWNSGCKNTPWGPVKVGYSNTAYSTSLPAAACSTVSEVRTCAKKVMSGSFVNTSCTDGCVAGTTANCNYVANASGASSGTCAGGYTGACSYSCSAGARTLVSNTCVSACGGASVGGYCWYLGAAGATCDSVCATHGGCVVAGIRDYAGSSGTLANCVAVLAALGKGPGNQPDGSDFADEGSGCGWQNYAGVTARYRIYSPVTTCAAVPSFASRACSCNN